MIQVFDRVKLISDNISAEFETKPIFSIDRTLFEVFLADEGIRNGLELITACRVINIQAESDIKELIFLKRGFKERVRSKFVIAADGAASLIRRRIFKDRVRLHYGIQAVFKREMEDVVEIYPWLSDSGFSWRVPYGSLEKIGVVCEKNPVHEVNRISLQLKGDRPSRFEGGLIPDSHAKKLSYRGIVLVGDAAGFVKPISRGGIYWGMKTARIASKYISKALMQDNPSLLGLYGFEVKRSLYLSYIAGKLGRHILKLAGSNSDIFIGSIDDKTGEILGRHFNIDKQGLFFIYSLLSRYPVKLLYNFLRRER